VATPKKKAKEKFEKKNASWPNAGGNPRAERSQDVKIMSKEKKLAWSV